MTTTEQMKTEHELYLYKVCFERAPISIFRVGTDSRVLDANDQACKSLGYTHEELVGMTIFDIKPDFSPEIAEEYMRELYKSGAISFETTHQRKDGSRFPVEIWIFSSRIPGVRVQTLFRA